MYTNHSPAVTESRAAAERSAGDSHKSQSTQVASYPAQSEFPMQFRLRGSVASKDQFAGGQALFRTAYRAGIPAGEGATVNFVECAADRFGQPCYDVVESARPAVDGLGSHLIGKIIDDGNVSVYFEEYAASSARPVPGSEEAADRGEAVNSEVFLTAGASAIELIHELIHSYHFAFDPWTKAQREAEALEDKTIAEEASTVGLGEWADVEEGQLTENAFRAKMGLANRDVY